MGRVYMCGEQGGGQGFCRREFSLPDSLSCENLSVQWGNETGRQATATECDQAIIGKAFRGEIKEASWWQ